VSDPLTINIYRGAWRVCLFACAIPSDIRMCIRVKVLSWWTELACDIFTKVPSMGTSNQDGDIENDTLDFWRDWDLSELTEDEYLSKVLGPKYLSLKLVIPLTITYVVIFITGIFGNVATCTVIIRNSSMQTATNYYLFSLAISDLTLLLLGERTKQMSRCYLFMLRAFFFIGERFSHLDINCFFFCTFLSRSLTHRWECTQKIFLKFHTFQTIHSNFCV